MPRARGHTTFLIRSFSSTRAAAAAATRRRGAHVYYRSRCSRPSAVGPPTPGVAPT